MHGYDKFIFGPYLAVPDVYAKATQEVADEFSDGYFVRPVHAGDFASYLRGNLPLERIRTKRSDA